MGDCPAHFFITLPANGPEDPAWTRRWQGGGGRGFTRTHARQGAIFEALERASLISSGPQDPRVTRIARGESMEQYILRWMNFSTAQLHVLGAVTKDNARGDCEYPVEELWVNCENSTTLERIRLPALQVLFGEDSRRGLPAVYSTSTGSSLRDTAETAARQAVLELVERDAVAIWWYNHLVPHQVPAAVAGEALPDDLVAWLADRQRRTWHLCLADDLPATTVVAISARADGTRPAIGASAALDPVDALRSATLEMLQGEIALITMRAAQRDSSPPPPPPLLAWSETTNALATPYLAGSGLAALPPVSTYEHLLAACQEAGIEIVTADLTRPELGVPVVKALSPQLRDWLPRFGPGRLYDVPVALGLRSRPLAEHELNPVPFVI